MRSGGVGGRCGARRSGSADHGRAPLGWASHATPALTSVEPHLRLQVATPGPRHLTRRRPPCVVGAGHHRPAGAPRPDPDHRHHAARPGPRPAPLRAGRGAGGDGRRPHRRAGQGRPRSTPRRSSAPERPPPPSPRPSGCGCAPSGACSSATSATGPAGRSRQLAKTPEWTTVQRYPSGFRFPGGESFTEMQTRITSTLARLAAAHPGETIVAVSHADPIKAALADALGHPPRPVPAHRRVALLGQRHLVRPDRAGRAHRQLHRRRSHPLGLS